MMGYVAKKNQCCGNRETNVTTQNMKDVLQVPFPNIFPFSFWLVTLFFCTHCKLTIFVFDFS